MHAYRTHTCGELKLSDAGTTVRLSGWVHRNRDHGQLLFVDLRDNYGVTQVVVDSGSPMFAQMVALKLESVVTVTGVVLARSAETVNAELATGEVEIQVAEFTLQTESDPLPFPVNTDVDYPEETRLKYRFLDLRREAMHANILLRSRVIASIRRRMIDQGFTEFQTPILTSSSPEGARDFLVPSRVHPGQFYALPQAPQQFKQLLMVAGFDRYFQIAPCFRDEDARADRSPGEFYQLDFEMSFVTQEDVFAAIEPVLGGVFEEFANGKTVTECAVPAHRLCRRAAEIRLRQARSAQPADHHRRRRRVPRLRLRRLRRRDREGQCRARHPRAARRRPSAQLLRQAERLGAGAGRQGPGLRDLRGRVRQGPDRQVPGRGAPGQAQGDHRRRRWRQRVLRVRCQGPGDQARRCGTHEDRPGAGHLRDRHLQVLLDRRFPDVRAERGYRPDRIQPQPVLDAAGRAGGAARRRIR